MNFNPDLHCFVCLDLLFIWRVYKFFFTFADILKDEKSNWNKFDVLTNMVLLAHVFIPHHHALSESCSISYHQSNAAHHCRHLDSKANFSENDRNAHRELGLKDCLLDNIYIRFVNDSHTLHFGGDDVEGDSPFSVLYLPADYSNRIEPESTPLPFLRKPHLISLYTGHIAQSKGLRAPPFC